MKESKDGILALIIILILVGLAWDPIRNYSQTSSLSSSTSRNIWFSNPSPSSYQEPSQTSSADISATIKETENKAREIERKIEADKELAQRSPYFGKISMSYVSYLNNPDPSLEYINIYTNLNAGEKIDVTGWRLISERSGNSVKIGKASTLPIPYNKNYEDVVLKQGDILYLVKGFSPIGISFRTNKCTGFFTEDRTFYPYLQKQCPLPRDEDLPQFSRILDRDDECKDLVERIPACTTPARYTNLNKLPDTVTTSCKEYLRTQVNYNSCIANHLGDTDFPGREWYVYLNIFGPLWRDKREKIILHDNNGLVVSSFSY